MCNDFKIIVTGKYACFTSPQHKTETYSYDFPTPSAMIGLVKSIYYKPSFNIIIDKIVVFNPVNRINVYSKSLKVKRNWNNTKNHPSIPININDTENRAIRCNTILTNVKYGIEFHIEMSGHHSEKPDECIQKHFNIMLNRLKNGKCFRQPYLGRREFGVDSIEVVHSFNLNDVDKSLLRDFNLYYMLYDLVFEDGGLPLNNDEEHSIYSNKAIPRWYNPHIINGVIDVDKYKHTIKGG